MRDENQTGRHSQDEQRRVATPSIHALDLSGPITLFVSVYVAIFLSVAYAAATAGLPYPQWAALTAVVAATAFTVRVVEGGRWRLGVFVPPLLAARDFLVGIGFAVALILTVDALVIASTSLRQLRGGGFPALELITVFIPAAVHEELAFRGYLFQKMRTWNRAGAITITSAVFALLHSGNRGITALAIANLFLAGVLLALAYEWFERLWFPIGIHLAWNILSGPVLGFGVSGYLARSTLFRTAGSAPAWLSGGTFGIEGSAWMLLVESGGIFWLWHGLERKQ